MNIVVTGGGTGGHLVIAKSLGIELKKRGIDAIFIGSLNGQDKFWFENSDIFLKTYFLKSSGVVNKKGFSKIKSILNILKLSFECKKIFKDFNVKAVISVGGYSAAAASFGAFMSRLPLFIHEQNAQIGKLNKILKPFSKAFYSSYYKPFFPYPIRDEFFNKSRIRKELKKILFLGGSGGAKFINDLALNLAKNLNQNNIKIIHQSGLKDYDRVCEFYSKNNIQADVFAFSDELANKMQKADLCISRSGASSLWELCANGLPSIFIPFPFAANDHQFLNAKFLKDQNLSKIFRQENINESKILDEILNYDLENISLGLMKISNKNGAKTIIDDILNHINFK
ncbi:undecaprenyldiphospho-muramoylpentapeptide beta-N-acetylglucosaminyltransferase [Campylobacter sp. FMV-PI01]|uniref:UDP-N-acetylglucosamine--N-acetylmuramyl-(pentapeptide) pyrophosphoryl-undecaprenol N-acetylglucosamine transferase n=1 Tax=Campylobacter portucalensis TaxID=2608384 RepID=A0A6L5WM39_9BACT|nr:undecaprenyldiphospho-muramoylpentapeptide beta-N-acetylglucosaminyltransferase [Campylobacter portucalensis]MSN96741.1 undecaprenyldiphospho-muramoylpentapeptide beta-N-acetylglucosaminyltransferase [Campylobacter portucalensis]